MKKEILEQNKSSLIDYKNDFFNFIDVTETTRKSYAMGISSFAEYLSANNCKQPTRDDVIAFREELRKNHSIATVNSYLIAVRQFFTFLEYNNIYKNITTNVKSLKETDIHKKKALTITQCEQILGSCDNLRDKTLFALTLNCGLRANELVNIRLQDFAINQNKVILYVLGKGRDYKQDYVIVSDSVYKLIQEYIKEYNIQDYLFVSSSHHNNGGKVTTETIRRIVNKLFKQNGIEDSKITLHSLRHSFATISIENGADLRQVSAALRHSSTSVTERYLHDLDMINNKCSDIMNNTVLNNVL